MLSLNISQGFQRILASRLAVLEALITAFDETFLMDCITEVNLSYLVNQSSDPLNVHQTENIASECILSRQKKISLSLSINNFFCQVH